MIRKKKSSRTTILVVSTLSLSTHKKNPRNTKVWAKILYSLITTNLHSMSGSGPQWPTCNNSRWYCNICLVYQGGLCSCQHVCPDKSILFHGLCCVWQMLLHQTVSLSRKSQSLLVRLWPQATIVLTLKSCMPKI